MASLSPSGLFRQFIGWTAAVVLLMIFPFVVPCMIVLRLISNAFTSPKQISGNVVIITGASSGIGNYIALEYAKYGAKLVLVARRESRLREVADACLEAGAMDAAVCVADITKDEDCRRAVEFTLSTFGRVDVLVNNAGMAHSGLFEDFDDASDFKRTIDLDFYGTVRITRYALEHLRRTKGSLVVIASVGAYVPYPRQSLYNAAKGAIVQFFDTLRSEPVGRWIDITIAMPGFVVSEMTQASQGHIPWWWPMLGAKEAAKAVVDASIKRKRYVIVPKWYATWIPYRVFAPELMDWLPKMFLVGRPPSAQVEAMCYAFLGQQLTEKIFNTLSYLATGIE